MNILFRIKNKIIFLRNQIYKKNECGKVKEGNIRYSHVTYCAVGNAGDTMLSQCVRREFLQYENVENWNIIQVTDPVVEQTIEKINNTEALVIGGGGLFIEDTNPNSISGWQWPISEELLEKINCPVLIFSVGYNYFRGQKVSEFFRNNLDVLVRKASFVGLRNMGSVRAVQELLPQELKDKVVYQPCITTLISKLYKEMHEPYGRKIAYNIAFDRIEKRFGDNVELVLEQIAKSAKELSKQGYEITYVAHMREDFQFLKYLEKEKVDFKKVNLTNELPPKIISFYKKIDVVLGMRGHAQMIPFGMNCGIITLGSHDKMRWFLEDINQKELYIELQEDEKNICKRILKCFDKYYSEVAFLDTINNLKEAQNKLERITRDNFDDIHRVLKG